MILYIAFNEIFFPPRREDEDKRMVTLDFLFQNCHRTVDNIPHLAPRGILSMVGPTDSNSRQNTQHWLFISLIIPKPPFF
jgi:hypothetical protein